jgi:hypothetical protein
VTATAALVELVRDALRDPSIRDEIKAIVSADEDSPTAITPENEPLIDAHAAGKLLGMSAAAVRAAAFRGTLRSHHIGRLLRFRPSELLPQRRPVRSGEEASSLSVPTWRPRRREAIIRKRADP